MERKETFLESRPQYDDFDCLIADQLLTDMSDKKRIEILKKAFGLAIENYNDKVALKFLNLIDKAIHEKERGIAEGPDGDGHLGRASDRAGKQLCDYLMEIYWQLPDMKPDRHACRDIMRPTMLQTKFWILEQIAQDWQVNFITREISDPSIRAFQFLIAAYDPLFE
jgi:hypothetical protein